MNAANERRLTLPWVVLVLVLAALLLAMLVGLGRSVHWDPPRARAPVDTHSAAARLPPPVPLQRYAEVWQEPLFSPDRKPTNRAGAASNIGDLELTGIILTPDLRMALLRNTSNHTEIRVREGTALPDGSATLTELRPRSAVFDAASGRVELKLPSGAPIDAPRAAASALIPPLPDEAPERPHSKTGLSGDPVDEQDVGAPAELDESEQNSLMPPPRRSALPQPARDASASDDEGQDESQDEGAQDARVRKLRDIIQKRRAEQAAPASQKGDR